MSVALLDSDRDGPAWRGRPPFFVMRVIRPRHGMWGPSLILRAESYQDEHDRIQSKLQDGGNAAGSKVVVDTSRIDPAHLDNDVDGYLACIGPVEGAITQWSGSAGHPDNYQRLGQLEAGVFRAVQANEMFATGDKQPGLNSGKAIRNMIEIRAGRHTPAQRELEAMNCQRMREIMRAEKRWSESHPGRKLLSRDAGVVRQVSLVDLETDENRLQLEAMPSSDLPLTISGRLEELGEAFSLGVIDATQYITSARVRDWKDLESRLTAPVRVIEACISEILRDGQVQSPPKWIDSKRAIKIGVERLSQAYLAKAPPERLRAMRAWLDELAARLEDQAAAAAPPPVPPGVDIPMTPPPMGPAPMPPIPGPVPGNGAPLM